MINKVPHRIILFNVLTNDLDDRTECTLTMFVADTKVRGEIDIPEGKATTQIDLDRPKN